MSGNEQEKISSDNAGQLMADMWAEMSSLLRSQAVEAAAVGEWRQAIDLARAADVATWQATGEGDCTFLKDLIK